MLAPTPAAFLPLGRRGNGRLFAGNGANGREAARPVSAPAWQNRTFDFERGLAKAGALEQVTLPAAWRRWERAGRALNEAAEVSEIVRFARFFGCGATL